MGYGDRCLIFVLAAGWEVSSDLNLVILFAFPVFEKHGLQQWVRRFFLANALITPLFAITYSYPTFSVPMLLLGEIPWAITVPGCLLLLALFFKKNSASV